MYFPSITFFDPAPAVDSDPSNKCCNFARLLSMKAVCSCDSHDNIEFNNLYDFFCSLKSPLCENEKMKNNKQHAY